MQDEIIRILFGESDTASVMFYVEIVFRTLVMYLYTLFLARMVGQGGIGQIGPFEFVLVIAVGSAAGDPMFYPDVGLLQGILVITVVIMMHRMTGYVLDRFRPLEDRVEGLPVPVVVDGRVVREKLGSGTVTEQELMTMLRVEGVRDVGDIELAYLETSGKLSVFRFAEDRRREVKSTLPSRTD